MVSEGVYRTVAYEVDGLKGDHCRDRIEHTLAHLPGVDSIQVDMATNRVVVSYDPGQIADGYIQKTLETLGYAVIK